MSNKANYKRNRAARLTAAVESGKTQEWKRCSDYHFQRTMNGQLVNWWPSSRKVQIAGEIFTAESPEEIYRIVEAIAPLEKKI